MKIEDQVCTLEQAKKLKELGVKQESNFFWTRINKGTLNNDFWLLPLGQFTKYIRLDYAGVMWPDNASFWANDKKEPQKEFDYEKYSAFTVAELALPEWAYSKLNSGGGEDWCILLVDGHKRFPNKLTDSHWQKLESACFQDTEAKSRGAFWLYILENKIITAEEINARS